MSWGSGAALPPLVVNSQVNDEVNADQLKIKYDDG